jgi:hypothetical protein
MNVKYPVSKPLVRLLDHFGKFQARCAKIEELELRPQTASIFPLRFAKRF